MLYKNIPNLLTLLRIALAVLLLWLKPPGLAFIIVYLLCGLTDVLDGMLARKMHTESVFGSRLDSAADLVMFAVLIVVLYPIIKPSAGILLWIAAIALIRLGAAAVVWARFGTPSMLHTIGNKVTGALLFLLPLSLVLLSPKIPVLVLCVTATLSALEELLVDIIYDSFEPDRKSVFVKSSGENKKYKSQHNGK